MLGDLERAREALHAIPPDLARDEWVKVGMAAHAAGLDFDAFNQWSAQAANYDPRAARDTWRSFKSGKGIGPGTLFAHAKEHGHKPAERPNNGHAAPIKARTQRVSVATLWARFDPATPHHPYIEAKLAHGAPLDGLRVVPEGDPLTIAGQRMAGALVVPAYGPDGLQSMQFIPPEGKKLNAPGAPMAGAWFTVGDLSPGPVYVCEGIGQAWACWTATGRPAVVCFGWGNVERVARALNRAQLVLVPDSGKEDAAQRIARDLGCAVAFMPEGEPANFDANDYGQREGFDALEVLLTQASSPELPPPLLKPLSVADVLSNPSPPPRWAWDGFLPHGVVSMFGAHGGTGKSTVALMLAVCADLGRPLFGVPVEQGPALFVSLEDSGQVVRHRLAAICRAWHIDPQTLRHLRIVDGTSNPELFTAEGRGSGHVTAVFDELRKLVQSGGFSLVVIDNASDAFGADEIQRVQVRAFVRSLATLAAENDAAVLILAHVDKGTSRARKAEGGEGYSGSTAWHNSVRSRLLMSRAEDGTLTLEHQKSNLGPLRDPLTLIWPPGGLPESAQVHSFAGRLQGRADDESAAAILRLIAEYEARQQYASPATTSRNHVHAVLKADPAFVSLKLKPDDTKRVITQAQRVGWLEVFDYRDANRKPHQRWTVTDQGRVFAQIPPAPTVPTAPTPKDGAQSAHGAEECAPTAPSSVGGMGGGARTSQVSAEALQ
ncbi:MAG: AAA family ATPase [Hydrogenophaga sp.]|nr:AAA family ATPase [Hydrogenophaga sp.]